LRAVGRLCGHGRGIAVVKAFGIADGCADVVLWRRRRELALRRTTSVVGPVGTEHTLAAAALLMTAGSAATASAAREPLFTGFDWGWLLAGALIVVVAMIQVFAPDLPDGQWVAPSGIPGRAVGNLRLPNQLRSLLQWSCIAVVALTELRRLKLRWAMLSMAAFVFAVVLTASRTGLVSVLLLGLWSLVDRRLSIPTRAAAGRTADGPAAVSPGARRAACMARER